MAVVADRPRPPRDAGNVKRAHGTFMRSAQRPSLPLDRAGPGGEAVNPRLSASFARP